MCQYIYQKRAGLRGKPCNIQSKINSDTACLEEHFVVPIDTDGHCVFHSNNMEWKRENAVQTHFLNLLSFNTRSNSMVPFTEVLICANVEGNVIEINNFVGNNTIDFEFNTFFDDVCMTNLQIPLATLDLNDCDFRKGLTISNSKFSTISFQYGKVRQFSMSKVHIDHQQAFFQNLICEAECNIVDCTFNEGFNFSSSIFEQEKPESIGEDVVVTFKNLISRGEVEFTYTEFVGGVLFDNCDFSAAKFLGTLFSETQATLFYNFKIPENGQWIFQGEEAATKIFTNNTALVFDDEDIKGLMIFENANILYLYPKHRQHIISLQKEGKVQINKGCLKYRYQTRVKNIETSISNIDLFEDLARTFANYFTASMGVNLGVEIVEKTQKVICYFYFTDEDLSEENLSAFFAMANEVFWDPSHKKATRKVAGITPNNFRSIDNLIDLFRTCLKMLPRFATDSFTEIDLENLAAATSMDDHPVIDPHKIQHAASSMVQIVIQSLTIGEVKIKNIESTNSVLVIGDNPGNITYTADAENKEPI